ncbi:MAG: efflux RND transporter periplasmic adaptor subunit [Candidatus Zixiibacteriota bacterium]
MKRLNLITLTMVPLILVITGCSSQQESKNMEQIYAEEGVPVKVETVVPAGFSSELEYNAVLTGIKESSAYARISDKIDRIDYQVGDYVEKDAVVLTFPTDNPTAQYFQSKVAFENAEATFARMKSYFEVGGLSKQDFDNAEAAYEVAKANWDAVSQSVLVKAPINGILTRINVVESENAHKDNELFAISQIDHLKARIWVSDKQISSFKTGQQATARWNGAVLKGRVVQVDMSMNQDRQAFGALIDFENPQRAVRCGVTAEISVATYQESDAIVVGRKNIIHEGDVNFVYVVENGHARKKTVTLGRNGGLDVEILSGLEPGEMLIVEGQLHLEDGKKIRIIESQANALSE